MTGGGSRTEVAMRVSSFFAGRSGTDCATACVAITGGGSFLVTASCSVRFAIAQLLVHGTPQRVHLVGGLAAGGHLSRRQSGQRRCGKSRAVDDGDRGDGDTEWRQRPARIGDDGRLPDPAW